MQYKLAVTVHRCIRSQAPTYLRDHCIPISEVAGRQHIRSARRQQLNVSRVRRVIGRRAFASAGPTVWNSLPGNIRDSTVGPDQFQRELKTHLFACLLNTSSTVRWRFFHVAALYKFTFTFTYLLTYLLTTTNRSRVFFEILKLKAYFLAKFFLARSRDAVDPVKFSCHHAKFGCCVTPCGRM